MQQGRVQLDADWNEQVDISGHLLQALARDIVGPHGGPGSSFKIEGKLRRKNLRYNFAIREGHYYVDGLLCENDEACTYKTQLDYPVTDSQLPKKEGEFLVYLDVWERMITSLDDPEIREVALGGPDTATRTKLVWQAKLAPVGRTSTSGMKDLAAIMLSRLGRARLPTLQPRMSAQPGVIPPQSGYTGLENHLYRVEVHDPCSGSHDATFKWSRDNGSVLAEILKVRGRVFTVAPQPGHASIPLTPGDWVEVSDDAYELQAQANPLRRIELVELDKMSVTLDLPPPADVGTAIEKHPKMRRWDQKENGSIAWESRSGTMKVVPDKWIPLESGIQVRFSGGEFRTGDYWQISARVGPRSMIWPQWRGRPVAMPPEEIHHHYCPLAVLSVEANGKIAEIKDLRRLVRPTARSP